MLLCWGIKKEHEELLSSPLGGASSQQFLGRVPPWQSPPLYSLLAFPQTDRQTRSACSAWLMTHAGQRVALVPKQCNLNGVTNAAPPQTQPAPFSTGQPGHLRAARIP